MTKKSETLKAKEEIQNLFKFGKRVQAKHISLVYLPNQKTCTRFLFCAERSAKKANQRNQIKRVLRALVSSEQTSLLGNWDIALIANGKFTELEHDLRLRTIKNLFLKLES